MTMMRGELVAAGLDARAWALNELVDGRHCLVLVQGRWVAGFFERGRFDERFSDADPKAALVHFVEWVAASEAMTLAGAEATERWLKQRGESRP